MKHLTASVLAIALTATAGAASAQQYGQYGNDPNTYPATGTYNSQAPVYDYARVIRSTPVYDSRGTYAASTGGQRCTESRTYAGGYADPNDRDGDGYRDGSYNDDHGYANDRYADGYGYRRPASPAASTAATVVGGIVGAVVGSQVGGGSARYATSAIGSMVGGIAGRQIYDQSRRARTPPRVGRAIACDPMPIGTYDSGRNVSMYDVTYEYAGRQYTTRTSYDPGNRIRVRVDVRPE